MFKLLVLYISLLTCSPGEELYARYGHTAIRVQDTEQGWDYVFNYGCFSFDTDHFYWKFVKGETYYQLGADPYDYFAYAYAQEGRTIYEQPLHLTDAQQQALLDALIVNYQPANRSYLYNFVFDNCATRPYYLIKHIVGDSLTSSYTGWEGHTYRDFIRHYTGKHSWEDFGINMIFGSRADQPMQGEARLFLPEELMYYIQHAQLVDGEPLVESASIAPFVMTPVPWYKTWWVGLVLCIILWLTVSVIERKYKRSFYGLDLPFIVVYVILFAIVIFLTYFSIHPLVGWNWRLFLFPLLHLCLRLPSILSLKR